MLSTLSTVVTQAHLKSIHFVSIIHCRSTLLVCGRQPWLARRSNSSLFPPFFCKWSIWKRRRRKKSWCERSRVKEWRAPLLGQFPGAETGYDTLNLTVECMTMAVCACMSLCVSCMFFSTNVFFFHTNGGEQEAPKSAPALSISAGNLCLRLTPHLLPLFCFCPTYSTQPLTLVWTHTQTISQSEPLFVFDGDSQWVSGLVEVENDFKPSFDEMSPGVIQDFLTGVCAEAA